jgi:alpha-1,2-mannosyltransferase
MRTARSLVLCLLVLLGLARIAVMLPYRVIHQDFAHYYLSSRLWYEGVSPYPVALGALHARYNFHEADVIPHATNPPPLVWLFAPLTALSPWAAYLVWVGLQGLSLLALLWGVRCLLGDRLPVDAWLMLSALTFVSEPVYTHFRDGQVQLLLAALILAAYAQQRRGWHLGAVALITLTGMLKLFPLALVPWFVWQASPRWPGRACYALEAVGLASLMVALTGLQAWRDFATYALPIIQAYLVDHPTNYSVTAWVSAVARASGVPATLAALVGWLRLGTLAGFFGIGLAYAAGLRQRDEPELPFALLSIAMVVGSPTAWAHYLVLLIAPLTLVGTVLWPRLSVLGRGSLIGVGLLVMTVGTERMVSSPYDWLNILLWHAPLYALLGLGGWLVMILRRAQPRVISPHRAALAA